MPVQRNHLIAKNTVFLFVRMLIKLGVAFYATRVILDVLGIVDYGIYNVVSGVVMMFSFLSTTMASASQRFFAFEIGRGDMERLKETFNATVIIYLIIAAVVFIAAETVGLWFLNSKMNIPAERMEAANWVFQFAVLSFTVKILTIPYNSVIIARENMSIYAYLSILEELLRLGMVYVLLVFSADKLKLYSVLMFISACIVSFVYYFICRRKYIESRFRPKLNRRLFRVMLSYSGWSMWGAVTGLLNSQGLNILLNLFFGPVVNAAQGIAEQVKYALTSFSMNFYTAINPQIVKSYAAGEKRRSFALVFSGSKLAFLILLTLSLPVYLEMDYVLGLWLKEADHYMSVFTRLVLIFSLVNILESPLSQLAMATGRIRNYEMIIGLVILLIVPVSYCLLKNGFPAQAVYLVSIIVYSFAMFIRLAILRSLVGFPVKSYIFTVLLRLMAVTAISSVVPFMINAVMPDNFLRLLSVVSASVLCIGVSSYFVGLNPEERAFAVTFIKNMRFKKR